MRWAVISFSHLVGVQLSFTLSDNRDCFIALGVCKRELRPFFALADFSKKGVNIAMTALVNLLICLARSR